MGSLENHPGDLRDIACWMVRVYAAVEFFSTFCGRNPFPKFKLPAKSWLSKNGIQSKVQSVPVAAEHIFLQLSGGLDQFVQPFLLASGDHFVPLDRRQDVRCPIRLLDEFGQTGHRQVSLLHHGECRRPDEFRRGNALRLRFLDDPTPLRIQKPDRVW